jgi:hypothetical protein
MNIISRQQKISLLSMLLIANPAINLPAVANPAISSLKSSAKSTQPIVKHSRKRKSIFNPPSSSGNPQPNGTSGGRSGELCPQNVPQSVTYEKGFQTASARPVFWVYLPYNVVENPDHTKNQISSKAHMEFILRVADTDEIFYESKLLPYSLISPGFFPLTLPDNKMLIPNVTYRWTVEIYCMGDRDSSVIAAPGFVKRVNAPNNLIQVDSTPLTIEQLQVYGQNGLWYETVDGIFTLHKKQVDDPEIADYRQQLLRFVEISEAAKSLTPK